MVGGWSCRGASLSFPFLCPGLLRVSRPRVSFAYTSCLITPTPFSSQLAVAALRGRLDYASTSTPFSAYHDMFGNGSQHRLSQQQQQTAVAPPLPPPKQSQISITSAFKPTPQSRYKGPPAGRSLHGPSLNTVLNKTNPNPLASRATPSQGLKPRETVTRAFDNISSSFADSAYQSRSSSWDSQPAKPQTQLSALHEAVFFDEGDFEDDGDLDFDDSIIHEPPSHSFATLPTSFRVPSPPPPRVPPPLYKTSREPTPPIKRAYENISSKSQDKSNGPHLATPPTSSAPLPWSSSPVEHLGPPAKPSSRAPVEIINLTEEAEARKKRRKIPWAGKAEAAASHQPLSKVPSRSRTVPSSKASQAPGKPQLPWDMTASEFKKASSVTRKKADQKRGMSTAAEPGERRTVLKQRKLQLTTEQMQVLNLVVDDGRSVFFTGSAGLLHLSSGFSILGFD